MESIIKNIIHEDSNYNNNATYRQCIRNIFNMKEQEKDENIDSITNDENNYDEETMARSMDFIYEKTKHHLLFKTLYQHGAASMFSLNNEIGLAVLCSYDYFHLFHLCLRDFVQEYQITETNINYQKLLQKLT